MLAALGLGPAEEEIYRLLVARGRAAVHELAAESGRATGEVRELLTALTGRGLAVHEAVTGTAARFTAAPPRSPSAASCGDGATSSARRSTRCWHSPSSTGPPPGAASSR